MGCKTHASHRASCLKKRAARRRLLQNNFIDQNWALSPQAQVPLALGLLIVNPD